MNEQEKKAYLEKYKKDKEKGVPFFPDIIFKDAIVTLIIFLILVALAYFIGAPLEARANPNDTSYTPRPEWYFLFLFQLLKYFPGNLEVIGAMVLPGLFILLLFALPFIDKSAKRNFRNRPFATVSALLVVIGVGTLTFLAATEAPPPQEKVVVDQAAELYATNCANCHGESIDVPPGTDLHKVIASGEHEGMPAWGGDLSTDEIDQLAGFILSPNGSALYTQYCETCHSQMVQAVGNPLELQRVFTEGSSYPPHEGQDIPDWGTELSTDQRNALLNFLAAPDGQRLFAINCSGCHGQGVAFSGTEEELRTLISQGGQHLSMPAWKGTLSENDLNALAAYVVDPSSYPAGETLFSQHCAACHGDIVPSAPDRESAVKIISSGGPHVTMPVWGNILTSEQLDALVKYTYEASKGGGTGIGATLFAQNCSACHGQFGEGGPNPTRAGDIIPPISTAEFLKTRDDTTIRNIISQGQPDLGMSPFGDANGGPLNDDQLDALVEYIRSWEANPPVEEPPQFATPTPLPTPEVSAPTPEPIPSLTGGQLYAIACASCHGAQGEGDVGPALNTQEFQDKYDDQALFDTISNGHTATPMVAWGDSLTDEQINLLVQYIRVLGGATPATPTVSFSGQIAPLFEANCQVCHNQNSAMAGWDSTSYQSVTTTGNNGPVVIAGDITNSILAQRVSGSQGAVMPPSGKMSDEEIQIILDWIAAGAPEN
jgi:menaquinol-cytochrome c reductase cytochrome b/c subunit